MGGKRFEKLKKNVQAHFKEIVLGILIMSLILIGSFSPIGKHAIALWKLPAQTEKIEKEQEEIQKNLQIFGEKIKELELRKKILSEIVGREVMVSPDGETFYDTKLRKWRAIRELRLE